MILILIVHYILHALFKGHFPFSNNVDKITIFIACINVKIQIASKTNPFDKGYLSIWSFMFNIDEYSCKMYQFLTGIKVFILDHRLHVGSRALRCWAEDGIYHLSGWCLFYWCPFLGYEESANRKTLVINATLSAISAEACWATLFYL